MRTPNQPLTDQGQRAIQPDGNSVVLDKFPVLGLPKGAATECHHNWIARLDHVHPFADGVRLDLAELLLAEGVEDVVDGGVALALDIRVDIAKGPSKPLGQLAAHNALSAAHEANQEDAGSAFQFQNHRRNAIMVACGPGQGACMRLHLIIDADDTLWESNIYFERAFEEFVSYLGHSRLLAEEIRAVLDEIELVNNKIHGYGWANFARNLRQCYVHLAEREIGTEDLDRVMGFGQRLLDHPMQVIDGVEETLRYLRPRHELILFTKGHPDEQRLKLDRSGLERYFHHTAIVKETDAAAYRKLVSDRGLHSERTWMIGNSPKSDVNPALEAGLRAVFIPHAHTWTLEREDVREVDGRLLTLQKFADLREHF